MSRMLLCCCFFLTGWLHAQTGTVQVDIQTTGATCADRPDGIMRIKLLAGTFPVTFSWTNTTTGDMGFRAFGGVGETVTLDSLLGGEYAFIFFEPDGRKTYLSTALFAPPAIEATFTAQGDKCFGENAGQLNVVTVQGGVGPYQFSLNNGPFDTRLFWTGLEPGNYFLTVADHIGCTIQAATVLPVGTQFILDIGADTSIFSGDTVRYRLITDSTLVAATWSPARYASTLSADTALLFPFTTTTFRVQATNDIGCIATDEVTVTVHRNRNVFIPNVFAPEATIIANRSFTVFTSGGVTSVADLQIFDRAGRLVFERSGFAPNDPAVGWDGTFQGKRLEPGVFLYALLLRYTDGRTERFSSDVTLVR